MAKIQGEITVSDIKIQDSGMGETYEAIVAYDYSVDGNDYRSNRLSFNESLFSSAKLESVKTILSQYPLGESVIVYYDPQNPTDATLQQGIDTLLTIRNTVVGVVTILLLIIVLFLLIQPLFS